MTKPLIAVSTVLVSALLLACGGNPPPAEGADDAELGAAPEEASAADPPEAPSPPSDGIVRDADGDGVPDTGAEGCEGKSQTQCQITAGCAWSDAGSCTEANDSGM